MNTASFDFLFIQIIPLPFRVGHSKAWSNEISFKTDCPAATIHTFAVMGDMGTIIPAGFLVTKQIIEDHQVTPFSSIVHVGDISYAGTGSKDEIAVSLERMKKALLYSFFALPRKFGIHGESK